MKKFRLSAKKWGRGQLLVFLLTAKSDDAQAVVGEVSEAVGAALDEFHLSVEALGDGVVFGKAPHGDKSLPPAVEGGSQTHERLESALTQLVNEAQKALDVLAV